MIEVYEHTSPKQNYSDMNSINNGCGITLAFVRACAMKDTELKHSDEDWKEVSKKEDEKKMMKYAKFSRDLATKATAVCSALILVYTVKRCLSMRTEGRLLFFPAYFPYETMTSPIFEFKFIGMMIGTTYYTVTYTAVDTFLAMLILHVCGQLWRLQNELMDLNSATRKEFHIKLRYIVKRHDYLNRFIDTIEGQFNIMLLFQILGCTVQLCMECFQGLLLMAGEGEQMPLVEMFFFAFYIVYVLLQLYLYCYVGEQLWSEQTYSDMNSINNGCGIMPAFVRACAMIGTELMISDKRKEPP
ncbi:odorant receptor 13a-like [Vespula squamosa]|uniref:Odorant receptor 13a-like n=1 Tax=Vespula squamosa TaxID=30214 RepID=A0ABD2A866_VESSQ